MTVVCEALDTERLVSLVGLAGVGKTRLALAVADRIHAGGAVPTIWIPGHGGPSGVDSDAGGAETWLGQSRAMLTSWVADRLSGAGSVDDLAELIGDRRTLLVIDAYESSHVLRDPLMQLLDRCTALQVLMTTRVPPPLRDVRTVPVSPLSSVTRDGAGTEGGTPPAVSLLLARLRCSRPTLEHTGATAEAASLICRALDGIPLALNLAAAWFPVYSPQQLVPMAEEAPLDLVEPVFGGEGDVDGGLRASVQQSISGLRPSESRLLRALALRGGALPFDRLVEEFGGSFAETAQAVHVLLLRGLVRQECTSDGGAAVAVLNLVRSILMAVPSPRGRVSAVAHA
ncbi:transcriptional regulator [Streptomyces sp. NPDC056465]